MPGPFPAPPIFWGKSPGDEVEEIHFNHFLRLGGFVENEDLGQVFWQLKILLSLTHPLVGLEAASRSFQVILRVVFGFYIWEAGVGGVVENEDPGQIH